MQLRRSFNLSNVKKTEYFRIKTKIQKVSGVQMGHYKRKKKSLGTTTKIIKRKNNFSIKNNKKIVSLACDQTILSFMQ